MFILLIIVVVFGLYIYPLIRLSNLEKRVASLEGRSVSVAPVSTPAETKPWVVPVAAPAVASEFIAPKPQTPAEHSETFATSLAKVGIAILVLGVGFFLRYINSLGLIGPTVKYIIGLIAGLALIVVAEYVKNKSQKYAALVRGGGFILWFMTLFTGTVLYKFVSLPVTLTLIVCVLMVSLIISFKEKSETTFLVGIVGAYITPVIMKFFLNDTTVAVQLLSYIAVINIGVIVAASKQLWGRSVVLSFLCSWLMFGIWSDSLSWSINWMTLWIFATIYALEFLVVFVLGDIKRSTEEKVSPWPVALTAINTLLYAGITYTLLDTTFLSPFLGFMIAVLGLFHFGVYGYIRTVTQKPDNISALTHFVIAVTLITAAIPVQFDGPIVTMIWFVEGVVLSYLAIAPDFRGKATMYVLGFTGIILGIMHMIFEGNYTDVLKTGMFMLNQFYIVWLFVVLLTHAVAYLWKKSVTRDDVDHAFALQIKKAATILMIVAQVCFIGLTSREIEVYGGYKINQVYTTQDKVYSEFREYHGYDIYSEQATEEQRQQLQQKQSEITTAYNDISHTTNLMEIAFFTLLTTIYLLFGLVGKNIVARRMGIAALVVTIGQLFVYTWSIGPVYRIAAFVGLGVVLLVVSYLYVRQSKKPKVPEVLVLALVFALTTTVHAGVIPVKEWSTMSAVVPPAIVTEDNQGLYVAEIPSDVLRAAATTDFRDIRLVDGTDNEIPYMLIKQGVVTPLKDRVFSTASNTKILENSLLSSERIVVLDTLKEGQVFTGVQLQKISESVNFRHTVHVYISDAPLGAASPAWRELEQKSIVYNYTDPSNFSVENLRVTFPNISSRYIKLRFAQDNSLQEKGASFTNTARITGARMITEQDSLVQGTHVKEYLAGNFVSTLHTNDVLQKSSSTENTKEKSTEVIYDLGEGSGLTYIHKLTLDIDSSNNNFKRNVTVQIPDVNDVTKWTTVASGQIYRIASPIFTGESLSIEMSAPLLSRIRVVIHNDNDSPLRVEDKAVIERQQVGLIFKKEDGNVGGLKFLIGNKNAVTPTYELQKTLTYFEGVTPTSVTLATATANPLYEKVEAHVPFGEKYKYLMNIALVLFVILLGYLGYRWSR